ncbi:MAG: TatD family hydrolase [Spirochaetia bacterium]|jgi:TatD DNase family protein|nr:TatD family hydrolase [Spirochaetia bacterium]
MFDCHRHLTATAPRKDALYCSSTTTQWKFSAPYYSLGLLPDGKPADKQGLLTKMEHLLASHSDLGIGEVGIDRRFPDIDNQVSLFCACLELAVRHRRFLTLHCVRETGLLLSLLEEKDLPPLVIWHGFTGSIETAKQAARLGIVLSIGPQVLKTKLKEHLKTLASIGFVIETDWEGPDDKGYLNRLETHLALMSELSHDGHLEEKCNAIRTILEDIQADRR